MQGLVLSGGGARGLAHIGVLEVLEAHGFNIEVVAGTSMGSIIGALWANGYSAAEILPLIKQAPWFSFLNLAPRGGLFSRKRLMSFLSNHLPERFEDLKRPFIVTAVDIERGESVYLHQGDLVRAVLASSAHPGLLSPVEYDNRLLLDGGILDNLPISAARFLGARKIFAVDVTPKTALDMADVSVKTVLSQVRRAADLMQERLTALRLAMDPPEVYIRPRLEAIGIEHFGKMEEIIEQGRQAAMQLFPQKNFNEGV